MGHSSRQIQEVLQDAGLKVTPQRMTILEAVYRLGDHPTVDQIIDYIRDAHPGIATGTVYKVLEVLERNHLVRKVQTDKDVMRYDGIMENHHHLYTAQDDRIEDYMDRDLDRMLQEYFMMKGIPGFEIEEIRLQIKGKFLHSK